MTAPLRGVFKHIFHMMKNTIRTFLHPVGNVGRGNCPGGYPQGISTTWDQWKTLC